MGLVVREPTAISTWPGSKGGGESALGSPPTFMLIMDTSVSVSVPIALSNLSFSTGDEERKRPGTNGYEKEKIEKIVA